jgi:hypothetical protein
MKAFSSTLALLLICSFLRASAGGVEVDGTVCRMTLSADDKPLTNVLAAIEAHTGVEIDARGELGRRVSLRLIDRSVDDVLDRLGLGFVRVCESSEDPGRVTGDTATARPPKPGFMSVRVEAGSLSTNGEFSLTWPTGLTPAADATLVRFLAEVLDEGALAGTAGGPAAVVRSFAVKFQREYDEFKRDFPDSALTYEAQLSTEVRRMDREFLSLAVNFWAYTGGAHGNTRDSNIVIDLSTGRRLTTADLFEEGAGERLTELIKDELRRGKNLPADASLEEAGFWEKDIQPTENFFVTGAGIGFLYNPYDIAPYAGGSFSPVIPFEKLRPLLRPSLATRLPSPADPQAR